jgi:hypothetical protein
VLPPNSITTHDLPLCLVCIQGHKLGTSRAALQAAARPTQCCLSLTPSRGCASKQFLKAGGIECRWAAGAQHRFDQPLGSVAVQQLFVHPR